MQTVALLSRKGGSGKTTLAVHIGVIAATTRRVLLIDCDRQRSLTAWWNRRDADVPELVGVEPSRLRECLKSAEKDGVNLCIVDTRPSVEADTVLIAAIADLVLIPSRPSILDLLAIEATASVVRAARSRAFVVLNAVPAPREGIDASVTTAARDALTAYGVPVATPALASRAAFAAALNEGLTATELEPGGKAAAEMHALYQFILGV